MKFEMSKIWEWYYSKPLWAKMVLFLIIIIPGVLVLVYTWLTHSVASDSLESPVVSLIDDQHDKVMKATKKRSGELDKEIKNEQENRENLKKEQKAVHKNKERVRDEICNADNISAVTNALHRNRS